MQSVHGVHVSFPKRFSDTEVLEFDQTQPPFKDVRVRRAFSLALNREQIMKIVMLGHAGYGTKVAPYEQPYAYTSKQAASLPYFKENLSLAKKLMQQAGYAHGFDTVMEVSPQYYQDIPTATIIQQQVARVGIRIKLKQAEWTAELNDFIGTKNPLSMIGTIWQPDPDASLYDIYYSKSPINLGKWRDPQIDHLLQLGRTTYDTKKRVAIYRQIEHIVADQVYLVFPFAWPGQWEMWRTNIHGYTPTPGGHRVHLKQTWKG
jgi:peptide/nickel transport system substrate-binding protein